MLAPGHAAPRLAAGLTRAVGGEIGLTYTHAINGFQFKGSAAAAAALANGTQCAVRHPGPPGRADARSCPSAIERISALRRGHAPDRRVPQRLSRQRRAGRRPRHRDRHGSPGPRRQHRCRFQQELRQPGGPAGGRLRARHPRRRHRGRPAERRLGRGRRGPGSRAGGGQGLRRRRQLERVAGPLRLRPRDGAECGRGQLERHRRHEHELRRAARVGRLPDRSASRRGLRRPRRRRSSWSRGPATRPSTRAASCRPRSPRSSACRPSPTSTPCAAGWPAASSSWSSSRPSATTRWRCSATTERRSTSSRPGVAVYSTWTERDVQDEQRHEHGDAPRRRCGRADGRRRARAHAGPGHGEPPRHRASVRTGRSPGPMGAAPDRAHGRTTPTGSPSR